MMDDEVTARVEINLKTMRLRAVRYGRYVKVLSPQSLAEEVKEALISSLKQYN